MPTTLRSADDLVVLSSAQLVALWNEVPAHQDRVSRFSSRSAGCTRLAALLAETECVVLGVGSPVEYSVCPSQAIPDEDQPETVVVAQLTYDPATDVLAVAEAPAATASAPSVSGDDARRICRLVESHPKRAGSASSVRWCLHADAPTVAEYVRRCVAAGYTSRNAREDVRWDVAHGFVALLA